MQNTQRKLRPAEGHRQENRRVAVVYRSISELHPDPRNPRFRTPKQIRQIARSLEVFGFNVPILVDTNLKIIAGHGRIQACRQLGWGEVPTIWLDHLNDAQARAFMIADNRLTENSVWNDRLLAEQLKELAVLDLDFSLEVTGFEMGEIDLRIQGLEMTAEGAPDPADTLPPTGPRVSRAGDLWLLGSHRVFCGSALDDASYKTLMKGETAAMVFTDPPFNLRIEGNVSGLGAVQHREFAMASGEMTEAEFTAFLTRACRQLARRSDDGSIHFVCMDWRHLTELLTAGRAAYDEFKNL